MTSQEMTSRLSVDQLLKLLKIRAASGETRSWNGKAYPIIEIAPLQGFYDYKNKYQAGSTIETCPAEISPELTEKMQHYAEAGAKALFMEGYCRLDFMMKENGDMYCLEANTLPGMTPTSLIPQEAKVLGIDYPTLCEKLIEVSMKKYPTQDFTL